MKALYWLVGVLGGAAAGFVIGRWTVPSATAVNATASLTSNAGGAEDALPVESPAPTSRAERPRGARDHGTPALIRERIRELSALTDDVHRHYESNGYFATLSLAELPTALAALQELPYRRPRSMLIAALMERWGELDGRGALSVATKLRGRDRGFSETKAYTGWAKADPRAAWAAAKESLTNHGAGGFRGAGVLHELARVDLVGAFHEGTTLESESARNSSRSQIVEAAAESGNLATVLQLADQLPDAIERAQWVRSIFQRWGSVDTDAPMQALRTINDAEIARSAMGGMVSGWSEMDPRGALEFVLENRDDPLLAGTLSNIVGSAAGTLHESEMREVLETARARGQLVSVPPEIVRTLSHAQPALGFELAAALTDETERNRSMASALGSLARQNFSAAVETFERMPASPARVAAFGALTSAAMDRIDGGVKLAAWMETFSGNDRIQVATRLVENLERRRRSPTRLRPESVAALAEAIAETPNLPPDTLTKARELLQPTSTR